MIVQYPSTAAIRQAYISSGAAYMKDVSPLRWFGDETADQTLEWSLTGNLSLVPQAEAILSKLDTAVETPRRLWDRSPAGAFCSVPDVIAGLPTPMRRQVYVPDERATVNILVATSSSAGISAEILRKRGIVILALVMALSRVRPVSLHQLATLDGWRDRTGETIIASAINTTPLDLATAAYVLTSSGFSRRLTYSLGRKLNDFGGSWPRDYRYGTGTGGTYMSELVVRLGFDPKFTLYIAAPELHDELLSAPLTWVNNQVRRFTQTSEED